MRQRGSAQGRTPDTHALTAVLQGKYHYTIGPHSDPVLKIRPGDRVVVETRDAFEGRVKTEQDLPSRVLSMPFVNPPNGPILVQGASRGDVLAVYIQKMSPRGANPCGTCAMIPQFGPPVQVGSSSQPGSS
ncbi:MAG: acetamidase/formamidase family protein [Burkholderiales bacterium]|nr:acetamidase/formamidase family protein [Burkholderiales bacterium]